MTPTPPQRLRDDLTQLEKEIALLINAAPASNALQGLRKRADEIRRAIEAMLGGN